MAERNYIPNITIEDARLLGGPFRNFSGRASQFNREGDRNFGLVIPPELVDALKEDGWNVKKLEAREEGDQDTYWLKVKVHYSETSRPPRVTIVSNNKRTPLSEEEVMTLDWVDIKTVDVVIRPYEWDVQGNTGVSAYLQQIYVILNESELDRKYADLEISGPGGDSRTDEEEPTWATEAPF